MNLGRFASASVVAVFLLMGFVCYMTLFVFLQDHASLRSAAAFSFLGLYCLFCFIVCLMAEPGQVPSYFVPDVEGVEISGQESGKNVRGFILRFLIYWAFCLILGPNILLWFWPTAVGHLRDETTNFQVSRND